MPPGIHCFAIFRLVDLLRRNKRGWPSPMRALDPPRARRWRLHAGHGFAHKRRDPNHPTGGDMRYHPCQLPASVARVGASRRAGSIIEAEIALFKAGIIHQDVTPRDVLISRFPMRVVLIDFNFSLVSVWLPVRGEGESQRRSRFSP